MWRYRSLNSRKSQNPAKVFNPFTMKKTAIRFINKYQNSEIENMKLTGTNVFRMSVDSYKSKSNLSFIDMA